MGAASSVDITPAIRVHLCTPPDELRKTCTEYCTKLQEDPDLEHEFVFTESNHSRTHDEITNILKNVNVFVFTVQESTIMSYVQALEYEIAIKLFRPIVYYIDDTALAVNIHTRSELKWLNSITNKDVVIRGSYQLKCYLRNQFGKKKQVEF